MGNASVLVLFVVVASVLAQPRKSPHFVLGNLKYGDVIVYKINEYKYAIPFFSRSSIIEYPPSGGNFTFAIIKAINIEDHAVDGVQGKAIILSGGVGQKHVKIQLESQRSSGFNFTVTVYGRY